MAGRLGTGMITRHRLLVLSDQAMCSLSNIAVTVLVARSVSTVSLGGFAMAMVAYTVITGGVRSIAGEPLLSLYSHEGPRARRGVVADIQGATLVVGLVCTIVLAGISATVGGVSGSCILALAIVLPILLVQDTWRYLLIIDRPGAALAIDTLWMVVIIVAMPLLPHHTAVGTYVLVWGAGGALAGVAGTVLGWGLPGWPRPLRWLRDHGSVSWRYLTEFITSQGVGQLAIAGLAAISGAAAVGAARAAQVYFGFLNVVHSGLYLALVPEGARQRHEPHALRRKFAFASVGSMLLPGAWMVIGLLLPESVGRSAFGATWQEARPLLVPMGLAVTAGGALSGGLLGMRALGDARRSLRARLYSAAPAALFPLIGAAVGDARGFIVGFGISNVVAAVIWWTMFVRATTRPAPVEAVGHIAVGPSPDTEDLEVAI